LWRQLATSPLSLRINLAVVCVIIIVAASFMAGARYFDDVMMHQRQLKKELSAARKTLKTLGQEKANLELADTVNRGALEQLRKEMVALELNLAKRDEELGLYRTLMRETEALDTPTVESLTLRPGSEEGVYLYRMVVQGKSTMSKAVEASVTLQIEGKLYGRFFSIPFNEADLNVKGDAVSVRFKYFKVMRGSFVLPAGFEPEKVRVSVLESGEANSLRLLEFPWRVEQPFASPD
jgi:hypothetical protein